MREFKLDKVSSLMLSVSFVSGKEHCALTWQESRVPFVRTVCLLLAKGRWMMALKPWSPAVRIWCRWQWSCWLWQVFLFLLICHITLLLKTSFLLSVLAVAHPLEQIKVKEFAKMIATYYTCQIAKCPCVPQERSLALKSYPSQKQPCTDQFKDHWISKSHGTEIVLVKLRLLCGGNQTWTTS